MPGFKSSPKGDSHILPGANTAVVLLQVFYYADRIFESAGVASSSIQYVTVSIGAINVVMTLLAVSLCWGSRGSHFAQSLLLSPWLNQDVLMESCRHRVVWVGKGPERSSHPKNLLVECCLHTQGDAFPQSSAGIAEPLVTPPPSVSSRFSLWSPWGGGSFSWLAFCCALPPVQS